MDEPARIFNEFLAEPVKSRPIRAVELMGGAVLGALACAAPAYAQISNPLAEERVAGEIVVTAQKRAERLEDVPISIAAVSGEQLEAAGVRNLADAGLLTVGLNVTSNGNQIQPTIRGITSQTGSAGQDNNVAIYIDGIYQASSVGLNQDMLDIKSVQILKGPQGTLFGRNSTAGAILIETLDPEFSTSGRLRASYGRFNDISLQGYVNVPVVDDVVAFNFSGLYRHSDGYLRDILKRFHPAPIESHLFRGKLLFQPSSDLKFILSGSHGRVADPSTIAFTVPTRNVVASENPGLLYARRPWQTSVDDNNLINTVKTQSVNLTGEYDIGWSTLKSITSYTHQIATLNQDSDGTPIGRARNLGRAKYRTFTQEVNLNGSSSAFDWVLGGFYLRQNVEQISQSAGRAPNVTTIGQISDPREFGARPRAWAVYADGTWRVSSKLSVIAGLRYSHETKTLVYPFPLTTTDPAAATATRPYLEDGRSSKSWDSITPRASLVYEVGDRTNVYLSYNQGFKSGTFGSSLPTVVTGGVPAAIAVSNPADPEKVRAYEVGFKTAQSGWRFNAAAFFYDYRDMQVSTQSLLPPPAPPNIITQLTNAASSEIYGIEFSGSVDVTDRLTVSGGLGWSHARYKDFVGTPAFGLCPLSIRTINGVTALWDATGIVDMSGSGAALCNDTTVAGTPALPDGFNTRTQGLMDRSGDQMLRAPDWMANLAVDYSHPTSAGELGLNATASYSSSFALGDLSPNGPGDRSYRFAQPSYVLINARLSFKPAAYENLTVTFWGKNLANEVIYRTAIGSGGDKYGYGEPRTYGVQIDLTF